MLSCGMTESRRFVRGAEAGTLAAHVSILHTTREHCFAGRGIQRALSCTAGQAPAGTGYIYRRVPGFEGGDLECLVDQVVRRGKFFERDGEPLALQREMP